MFNIDKVLKRLLIFCPIFKTIINSVSIIENSNVYTGATDGKNIFYNLKYISSISKNDQTFLFAHEFMHILLKHMSRRGDRDFEGWNYATDAVTNQLLKKTGLSIPNGCIDEPSAINYSSEEFYEIIKRRPDYEKLMNKYRHDQIDNKITPHDKWKSKEFDDSCYKPNPNNIGTNDRISTDNKPTTPNITEKNFDDINNDLVEEENDKFKKESTSLSSVKVNSPGYKKVAFGSVGNSDEILNWKEYLAHLKNHVVSASYDLFNGEYDEYGMYTYPFIIERGPEVEILIDSSGSISDNLIKSFLRECKNILGNTKLKIAFFDTVVYPFHEINSEEDIDNLIIEGRGGTNFINAVKAFSNKNNIKIVFTDGLADTPEENMDIIWIVCNKYEFNPPGGKVFYVDEKEFKKSGYRH